MLHLAAMWACCAIWVTCAQAVVAEVSGDPSGRGSGGRGDVPSDPHSPPPPGLPLLLACAAVLLPLSATGGAAAVQSPLAVATLGTLMLMCGLMVWALAEQWQAGRDGVPLTRHVFELPAEATAFTFSPIATPAAEATASSTGMAVDDGPVDGAAFRRLVFDGTQFGAALATFLFSFIVQQSVPSLTRMAAQVRVHGHGHVHVPPRTCTCARAYAHAYA